MFALGLRYLNGWSMAAADGARKEQAEWPPHPDRVFMALAAAWFETDQNPAEGEALRWLEALPPPAIAASDATPRATVVSYVPVNDSYVRKAAPSESALSKLGDFKKKHDKLKEAGLAVLPEHQHRVRQPRGFPVAIPSCPVVHLIWREEESDAYRGPLERLAAKVTHVGHSASFVQAWIDRECDVGPNWVPTAGVAKRWLRIPSGGRLDFLARTYQEASGAIERAETDLKAMIPPPRSAWRRNFPDAVLLADERRTKRHPDYPAAKAGDESAAARLVDSLVDGVGLAAVRTLVTTARKADYPILVCAHAYEREGVNAIPSALAELLSQRLRVPFSTTVVQSNVVAHTGADGYGRMARQARFEGDIEKGREYIMVDDFLGQGGTMANLRGWVEKQGGRVVGAVGLTGKPYSAKLDPTKEQLHELRQKHGPDFENWWRERFGHAFNCLTQSEARYLARSPDVDTIRDRLAAAQRRGDRPIHTQDVREQRRRIKSLKAHPPMPMRPTPGRWQGYARPAASESEAVPHSVFDRHFVVLTISGGRASLPATLKLTAALRGLLMKECSEQPPPEWFSGHRLDGTPTSEPHLALAPLPFVGAQHADGRIMGLAVVLPVPAKLDPQEAGGCLHPILHDRETGLPREHRLFGGQWFECRFQLETRERPPMNLDGRTWTRPSRVWATVTPVVLNRHFDGKDKWGRAAESVKDMCEDIGLSRPREVLLHPVSRVEGVPTAREFPRLVRKSDGGRRSHNHAVIVFDEPVRGPVLVGAGRFRGYGLCRPMNERGDERS